MSRACVRFLRLASVGRRRSPPRRPSDIRCHRRVRYPRRKPLVPITSRPRPPFRSAHREARRLPEDRDAISRHDTRRKITRRDCSLRPSRRLSRSRRPHFVPRLGRVLCLGLASVTVRSPAIRDGSTTQVVREYRRLFLLPRSRLGLTTQACQVARPTRPSTGADCPARTDAGRSA